MKIILTYDAFAWCMKELAVKQILPSLFSIPSFYVAMYMDSDGEDSVLQGDTLMLIKNNFILIESVPIADIDHTKETGSIIEIADNQNFSIGCIKSSKNYPVHLYSKYVNALNIN